MEQNNENQEEKSLILNKVQKNILEPIIKNKTVFIILIINLIIIICIIYILSRNELEYNSNYTESNLINTTFMDSNTTTNNQSPEKIKIHITGEVKHSGLYELELESRISDAIEKAGGITTEADLSKVNLAYELSDGQKIIIPSINQENNGNNIIEDSGEIIIIEDNNSKDKKININTATLTELTNLSGIGESTAQKIIDYREENGKFKNIEDIKKVSGIGESKYNQLKDYIKTK